MTIKLYKYKDLYMKIQVPEYYINFKCIADKCKDNCCIGWEIDVDDATLEKYESLEGASGDAIRATLNGGEVTTFKLSKNERCANLDYHGLCKIISALGEDYLCQICRDHPRYFNETTEGIEGGIGLACEAAAQLILTAKNPHKTVSVEYPEITPRYLCEEDLALRVREIVLSYIVESDMCKEKTLVAVNRLLRVSDLLDATVLGNAFSKKKQEITLEDVLRLEWAQKCSSDVMAELCAAFRDLEALTEDFPQKLDSAEKMILAPDFYDFLDTDGRKFFVNLLCYFLRRYFLSEEAAYLQNMGFAIGSALLICASVYVSGEYGIESFISESKNFSKNVEYSEENVDLAIENMGKLLRFF